MSQISEYFMNHLDPTGYDTSDSYGSCIVSSSQSYKGQSALEQCLFVPSSSSLPSSQLSGLVNAQQTQPDSKKENKSSLNTANPWDKQVQNILKCTFHMEQFRGSQIDIINSTLQGKHVFVLMCTGGGKSLCYQLPSLVTLGYTKGTTIVISPLISLMHDQVEALISKRIKACMLSSTSSSKQKTMALQLLSEGKLNLFYISPEMVMGSSPCKGIIRRLYRQNRLARLVIDEAHCISSWGHDFRPEYKKLGQLTKEFDGVPVMALTATANDNIQEDILKILNLKNVVVFKDSFNRKNLYYEVVQKNSRTIEYMTYLLKTEFHGQSGIIYCNSKASCEKVSKELNQANISSEFYHAGKTANSRLNTQRKWQQGTIQVVCATIAFGMGIDKENVRFVFHYDIPRSMEGYYQETGRAGRDGNPSKCILFFCLQDVNRLQILIQRENVSALQKEHNLKKLQDVLVYCHNKVDCRRLQILEYFNEEFFPSNCMKTCDNCKNIGVSTIEQKDFTHYAKQILSLLRKLGNERITTNQCQDIFRGSNNMKTRFSGYDNFEEHGSGKDLTKSETDRLFVHLLKTGYVCEYFFTNSMGYSTKYLKLPDPIKEIKGKVMLNSLKKQYKAKKKQDIDVDNSQSRIDTFSSSLSLFKCHQNSSFQNEDVSMQNLLSENSQSMLDDNSSLIFETINSCISTNLYCTEEKENHKHPKRKKRKFETFPFKKRKKS
ncbi:hypothetical protein B1J92_H00759g [Nakaseomyces glabratus]|nr:hypothetical protein B1J91_H00759g [Nakaseomyces glabratus]OXB47989.1 hypothetical protein B1J92_H00759g [Nakaseomyces glabratus]